ncbi:scamp-domain-containing protein [Schizopora paradoxa]|uniref:Scamp-domain-containing protein n=1 Tax=Schizopora paradoxa TaxID=27342 RepID=A0A0H2RYV6_9AGAM|nr:scamp-domain-containing protein [Schizopora paradoxa]
MANANPFASTHSLNEDPFADPGESTPKFDSFIASSTRSASAAELSQRERELSAREAALAQREQKLREGKRNNWPPKPFPYQLIYHDIDEEIPEASRPLIKRLYQLWLVLGATLVVNMIACIFFVLSNQEDAGKDLGTSISYLFFIGILSFLLWYRPIYNGYMKVAAMSVTSATDVSLFKDLYFFFCGFHLLFSVYITGGAGLIATIRSFTKGGVMAIIAGIISTIALAGWVIQGFGNALYYRQIWTHHNTEGHSFTKAKTELATHGAKAYFTRG